MNSDLFPSPPKRDTMNGKPVIQVPAKSVINFKSAFEHKKLCDGLTFSTGSACVYSCSFCYVPELMRKSPHLAGVDRAHEEVVIRRENALAAMRSQLTDRHGRPKFNDPNDQRVIYSSPLVDVAGNMELVRETIEACKLILELTHWQIRLLSKSNLLPKIAQHFDSIFTDRGLAHEARTRIIYGVSTGTLDDGLAAAFEQGTAKVSKRIESLHWLQDHGFRTFGMICPSLPQLDYDRFALEMKHAIRWDKCEHVWAEVINLRGESFDRTFIALNHAGFCEEALHMKAVMAYKIAWEQYARDTFNAHVRAGYKPGQLRFLQYVTKETRAWWKARQAEGAILL